MRTRRRRRRSSPSSSAISRRRDRPARDATAAAAVSRRDLPARQSEAECCASAATSSVSPSSGTSISTFAARCSKATRHRHDHRNLRCRRRVRAAGFEVELTGLPSSATRARTGDPGSLRPGAPLVRVRALGSLPGIDTWSVPLAWAQRGLGEVIRGIEKASTRSRGGVSRN